MLLGGCCCLVKAIARSVGRCWGVELTWCPQSGCSVGPGQCPGPRPAEPLLCRPSSSRQNHGRCRSSAGHRPAGARTAPGAQPRNQRRRLSAQKRVLSMFYFFIS